ncbi:MAG TPA: DUF5615 family PIN-like protein [Rhodospirillales bacterium]|nr:DUF5615 family PIN-like protein [Rhodospirillales bacterium]
MRILADECIGRSIVDRLRRDGFDITWAAEVCPGAGDETVLARAAAEQRVLLTLDKDFGELTVRMRRPTAGVIIVALADAATAEIAERTARALQELRGWDEPALTIIEARRIRRRRLDTFPGQ